MAIDDENYVVYENTRVTRQLLFADWPEKLFSGQSQASNSNASGTGFVRVSAQGLVSIVQKTFTTNILLTRLTAPWSPRMVTTLQEDKQTWENCGWVAEKKGKFETLKGFEAESQTYLQVWEIFFSNRKRKISSSSLRKTRSLTRNWPK